MNTLKEAREAKGFTQIDVANKIEIALRAYQNYESGLRIPRVDIAIKIADVLNVDVKEIFGRQD